MKNFAAMTPLFPSIRRHRSDLRNQKGAVAIEFAMVFLFGMLPFLLLTLAGVLTFAAKQSLTLAASNGARAALHYNDGGSNGNLTDACSTARESMNWLFALSDSNTPTPALCTGSSISNTFASIDVTTNDCTAVAGAKCVTVTTKYDYHDKPLIIGTGKLYSWLMEGQLQSTAVIQIYNTQGS